MPLQPLLMIGVGGSGAKALRTLRQTMLRRLRMQDWDSDSLPEAWQMLAVDTVTSQSRDGYPAPLLPGTDYLGLVPKSATYQQITAPMVQSVPIDLRQEAFLGWLVEKIPGSIEHGAGQNRAVGRGVAAARLGELRGAIGKKLNIVQSPSASTSLEQVAPMLGASGVASTPMVWVISSLAGGTGAGMFLDVIEALKAVNMNVGVQAQVVLFGPEVFQPLIDKGLGSGIGANTLAAVSEITSGIWSAAPSGGTVQLYEKGGMAAAAAGHQVGTPAIGSRYNYVIGSTNAKGVPIGTLDAAYQSVGDSLSALLLDENVLDRFNNFFKVNVFDNTWNASVIGDQSGLKGSTDPQLTQPFASFGSARVSLGMDRFLEYSSEAFTRDVVERLLWPRFTPDDPKLARPDHVRIKEQVELSQQEFIEQTGLNERGENNDLLDAIALPEARTLAAQFAGGVVARASGGVGDNGLAPAEWLHRIMQGVENTEQQLRVDMLRGVESKARLFASTLESRLNRVVSTFAAREGHGLAVAHGLIVWLRSEVKFVADTEMPAEAGRFETMLQGIRSQLSAVLEKGLSKIPAGHQALKDAEDVLVRLFAANVYQAARRKVAEELLRSVEAEMLAQMERALEGARVELLANAERDRMDDGNPNPFTVYPKVGQNAGSQFAPSPTELLLIPISEYGSQLEKRLRLTYGTEHEGQWKQRTIARIILDLPLTEADEGKAVGLLPASSTWLPSRPELRWADGAPQRPAYRLVSDIDTLRERAERLFSDGATAIGKFVGESLEGFLADPDPTEAQKRQTDFVNKLVSAFESSAPLVNINQSLAPIAHPIPDGSEGQASLAVSKIPLDTSSGLYEQVRSRLNQIKVWDDTTSPGWFGRTSAPQIDIFQATGRGMGGMVLDSLMRPVAQAWAAVRNNEEAAKAFWTWKRARPLVEALPASDDVLAQMAIGWTVAGFLGLRTNGKDPNYGTVVKVWDPSAQNWAYFPSPMFDRHASGFNVFSAVLSSMPLAMVEANATASLNPLAGYKALVQYARTDQDGALGQWLLKGRTVTPGKAPDPEASKAGTSTMPPEERRAIVLSRLERDRQKFLEHCINIRDTRDPYITDQAFEIRDIIETGYDATMRAAQVLEDLDV
jgi:hypothetical protein